MVCTTGEPVYPHQKSLIEEVFGVPLANEFGSRDIGFTAHESPGGQMLMISESIMLEVLDRDGRLAHRRVGRSRDHRAMLRCATLHSLLAAISSGWGGYRPRRSRATCTRRGGRAGTTSSSARTVPIMHALAVIYVLRAIDGIAEFKFVQHTTRDVEILVVPGAGWSECGDTGRRRPCGATGRRSAHRSAEVDTDRGVWQVSICRQSRAPPGSLQA